VLPVCVVSGPGPGFSENQGSKLLISKLTGLSLSGSVFGTMLAGSKPSHISRFTPFSARRYHGHQSCVGLGTRGIAALADSMNSDSRVWRGENESVKLAGLVLVDSFVESRLSGWYMVTMVVM
jgi:hypothetical protein